MCPVGLIGLSSGVDDLLARLEPRQVGRGSRPSVLPVTVMQLAVDAALLRARYFITAGVPPTACRSSMHELAAGLQVGEERHAVADFLEVVDGERSRPRLGPWRSGAARRWSSRPAP